MSELEFEALGRLILCLFVVVFALRGRYWLLAGTGAAGAVTSLLVTLGVDRLTTGRFGYVVYLLLAAHTLDVTRWVHRKRG